MSKYKVGMVSLGCDKNRVDSELILGAINKHYEITNDAKEADIIIVNTCGFIESAKQESIDTILEMAEYKNKYNCKMLIATGCLTQRYGDELLELIPEIDILMGVNDYMKLHRLILDFIKEHKRISSASYTDEGVNEGIRLLTTKQHTAYVRIAEGCNNFCTYCIIPKIRGKFRSRLEKNILDEVKLLVDNGVKEIILIAQDLTDYGVDIYGKRMLHDLVRKISLIEGVQWIRLLYCYPEEITDELIEEIANNDKVVKYLDLPIQHISSSVLKQMGRRTNKENIISFILKNIGVAPIYYDFDCILNVTYNNKIKKIKFIKKNISTIIDGKVRHDPYMVAESAIKLICNDLKYEDREDDPEYVMLNAKLKSDKRINKIKKLQAKMEKKDQKKLQNKKKKPVRKSKFNSKYSDRIQSIRESDEKFRKSHENE